MAQSYTVKVLSESEWKQLLGDDPRYASVDDDNWAFSDPVKRKGYARAEYLNRFPGSKALVLQHEFEHLVEDDPTHQDAHGIRHKKGFKEVARNIGAVSLAPFTGGASLSAGTKDFRGKADDVIPRELTQQGPLGGFSTINAEQPLGRALKGGAPAWGTAAAITGGIGAGIGPFQTSRPASAGAGGLGGGSAATPPSSASGNVVSKLAQGGLQGGGGGSPPPGSFPGLGKSLSGIDAIMAQSSQLGGGGAGAASAAPQAGAAAAGAGKFGMGKILGPALLGTGIGGVGQMLGNRQRPEIPELGQIPGVQSFRSEVTNQLGPLREKLGGLSNTPLPSNIESPIRRQFERSRKNLYGQFAAFKPGVSLAGDSDFRQAMADLDQQEAESVANAQFSFQGNERENILASLGVSTQELSQLQQLAQLDIDTIMARTGLQAQDANQLKEMFGNLGSTVAGAGVMNAFMGSP